MRTLKILGFLLTYPTDDHLQNLDECRLILKNEKWLSNKSIKQIDKFIEEMEKSDLLDLQENYVALFDRTPSLSLHLFEHIHGDSRDRGQALADLTEVFQNEGLSIHLAETPDYLPVFLEFNSTQSQEDVKENFDNIVNILCALKSRLENRKSIYAYIFEALIDTLARKPDLRAVEQAIKRDSGAAYDLEQLDKEWEEQFAFENNGLDNNGSAGCPKADELIARFSEYHDTKSERITK
ncbi:MAG: nitrate reductase molybdenum cofactor assembly chaperone [Alphaproteobacteria bacterium]|nr:nitrate reductase molybdenum cofactor assembly chaperone [Alphaproteobacteria bacterium]HPF47563.1 nitrate reductase molybdenum cofactor assembly chaperone [Emcibacteraceae bacterium]